MSPKGLKGAARSLSFDGGIILAETAGWVFYLSRMAKVDGKPMLTVPEILNRLLFVTVAAAVVPGLPIALTILLRRMKLSPEARLLWQLLLLGFLVVTVPIVVVFAACGISHDCI